MATNRLEAIRNQKNRDHATERKRAELAEVSRALLTPGLPYTALNGLIWKQMQLIAELNPAPETPTTIPLPGRIIIGVTIALFIVGGFLIYWL